MVISRRTFFKLSVVSFFSIALYRISFAKPEAVFSNVFPAFLDTLIPADQTPSATQLHIEDDIRQDLEQDRRYWNICLLGCLWLDKNADEQFKLPFANLDQQRRTTIVTRLQSQQDNQTAQFFFQYVKDKAFEYYYSKPQSWNGLAVDRPPQPLGYADYDQKFNPAS